AAKGCLTTAVAIGIQFACAEEKAKGVVPPPGLDCDNLDPGTLNRFLSTPYPTTDPTFSWYDKNHNLDIPGGILAASGQGLHLDNLGLKGFTQRGPVKAIDDALCGANGEDPHPVLVKVLGISDPTDFGHFVMITGRIDGTYTIQDPGCATATNLRDMFTCPNG